MCNEFLARWTVEAWPWLACEGAGALVSAQQGEFDFGAAVTEHHFRMREDDLGPVVILGNDGKPTLTQMRWGFPHWRDPSKLVLNVRNLQSRYWQEWLEPPYRCLVPVSEFAERDPEFRAHWFKLRYETPFMFAGLWRPLEGVRGTGRQRVRGRHLVFSFLTMDPNNIVGAVHDAMPVMLTQDKWNDWLTLPFHKAQKLIVPPLDAAMEEL